MRVMLVCAALCACCSTDTATVFQKSAEVYPQDIVRDDAPAPLFDRYGEAELAFGPAFARGGTFRLASAGPLDGAILPALDRYSEAELAFGTAFMRGGALQLASADPLDGVDLLTGSLPPQDSPRQFSQAELCATVAEVAKENELPVLFFANLIQQESGLKPDVVSPAGAQGIAQFMPEAAAEYGLADPFDPVPALHASGRFLSQLRARFGNLGLAAAAYNAGPKRVQDWIARRRKLPAETRHYVWHITGRSALHWAHRRKTEPVPAMPLATRCAELRAAAVAAAKEEAEQRARETPPKRSAAKAAWRLHHARAKAAGKTRTAHASVRHKTAAAPKPAQLASR